MLLQTLTQILYYYIMVLYMPLDESFKSLSSLQEATATRILSTELISILLLKTLFSYKISRFYIMRSHNFTWYQISCSFSTLGTIIAPFSKQNHNCKFQIFSIFQLYFFLKYTRLLSFINFLRFQYLHINNYSQTLFLYQMSRSLR